MSDPLDELAEITRARAERRAAVGLPLGAARPSAYRPLVSGARGMPFWCPNPNCGYQGYTVKRARGSVVIMILLFCVGVLPGLLYAIFAGGYEHVCPRCGMLVKTQLG